MADEQTAKYPALLLPVRIETRFSDDLENPELWVRLFPDQIAVDSFEPEVSDAEITGATTYWQRLWRAGTSDDVAALAAWRALAREFGAPRAAYLAQLVELQPTNLADRPAAATPDGQDPNPAAAFTAPPASIKRPASWSRAPLAAALPARFVIVLERSGAEVGRFTGAPIPATLAIGPDPSAPPPTPGPGQPPIDDGIRWMVDFDQAVTVGMGLRVPLSRGDRDRGFDLIFALGLRRQPVGLSGSDEFARLLRAHRFTDGLALIPPGSPTNNTPDAVSAYTSEDPDYRRSFSLERAAPLEQHDGATLAQALGLPADTFAHTAASDHTGQQNSRQMLAAVWPATMGYFLREMMGEVCTPQRAEMIRQHALDWLRPGGSLPSLRVGREPYGVLSATALSRFVPREHERLGVESGITRMLRQAIGLWRQSTVNSPHVKRSADPDADLVAVLGMDASARAYNSRSAIGQEFLGDLGNFFIDGAGDNYAVWSTRGREELASLGFGGWDPRVVHLALARSPVKSTAPIVQDGPVSETEGLPAVTLDDGSTGNYISWLRNASIEEINADATRFPGGTRPRALLYGILRQSILRLYAETAFDILIGEAIIDFASTRDRELVGFEQLARPGAAGPAPAGAAGLSARQPMTPWQALGHQAPGEGSGITIAEKIGRMRPEVIQHYPRLGELGDALDRLATLPSAELERLFTETIDAFSHRIDPWVASLADERRTEQNGEGPAEIHLGAYGWVQDVRAGPPPQFVEIDTVPLDRRNRQPHKRRVRAPHADNGGFIHAPSITQAAAGAVLRSGYLAHRGSDGAGELAIDLSSRRMRVALELIEGVRNGQSLSALLGYRFERAMHDAGGLDVYIQPLRDRYPVVANTLTEPHGPVEAVAASGVVDGMALHTAWQGGAIDWTGIGAGQSDKDRILAILSDLDDALDALGDVSLSESVFQSVRGNYERTGGLLDALSRGDRPPDPEVLRTPRGGTDYVNRLMILLTDGQARSIHWPGATNPRAESEPRLDAWASELLPRPQNVKARIEYRTGQAWNELEVSLADLGLGPLDALTIADAGEQPQLSEIEQRLAYHALSTLPSNPQVDELTIKFARDPAWDASELSIPEFMLVARTVRSLIGAARALLPGDLEPTQTQDSSEASLDLVEFSARAAAALARLAVLADDLDAATTAPALRSALLAASLVGAPAAIPQHATGSSAEVTAALAAQAALVSKVLRDLHDKAQAADAAFDRTTVSSRSLLNHLNGLLGKALGRGFVACPLFSTPDAAGVSAAFGESAALISGDPSAPARWLQQNTHVRAGVARWDDAMSMAELLGGRHRELPSLAQLPHVADDRWLALPFDTAKPRPTSGRVALASWTYGDGDLTRPAAGLLIDEWPERIPSETETTGVSFHYDQPDSRAPQALLLAVSPDLEEVWTDDTLLAILRETLDLAEIRTVDLESLTGLGQLLPAVLLPFNPDGATVAFTEYWLT